MKLTNEQKLEKQKRDNVTRLKNRILSEYQFKKWRNYHSYLRSIGRDNDFISKQTDRELKYDELKELLNEFQTEALKQPDTRVVQSGDTPRIDTEHKQHNNITQVQAAVDTERDGASNNYGLKESKKEVASLLWFQKKASAELLKGFY